MIGRLHGGASAPGATDAGVADTASTIVSEAEADPQPTPSKRVSSPYAGPKPTAAMPAADRHANSPETRHEAPAVERAPQRGGPYFPQARGRDAEEAERQRILEENRRPFKELDKKLDDWGL